MPMLISNIAACCVVCVGVSGASASLGWQRVQSGYPEASSGRMLVQAKGSASDGMKSRDATLYFSGMPKSDRFKLGIFIGDLDKEWDGIPWDDFRGPDLDTKALVATPLEMILDLGDRKIVSRFRILVSGVLLPEQDVGQMAEGVIVDSDETVRKGISMKEFCLYLLGGYKKIDLNFHYSKSKKKIQIHIPGDAKDPALSEFFSLIKASR